MEEKILIKSQAYNIKQTIKRILLVLLVFGLISSSIYCVRLTNEDRDYLQERLERREKEYRKHEGSWSCDGPGCEECKDLKEDIQEINNEIAESKSALYWLNFLWNFFSFITTVSLVGVALVCWLISWWLKSYELTVTDKRVYGKVAFGKRVDLPYDSISAISTFGLLKGISVATSSGRIKFRLVKNADEVYEVLNRLLLERQESKKTAPVKEVIAAPSNAAELKQYKELLDSGVISQEEFDAKKKQLLGL